MCNSNKNKYFFFFQIKKFFGSKSLLCTSKKSKEEIKNPRGENAVNYRLEQMTIFNPCLLRKNLVSFTKNDLLSKLPDKGHDMSLYGKRNRNKLSPRTDS